ncbi:far upstream element-binding protein 1 isoform X2 [Selaginella moellendorffii]|uniref:far upstream element-binding protein 1 isoform X2 n=1 Tax=Selaginella moellendorffii TaxID=88036 RepID=UPI000D1C454A|nr:far upstream element-binding protein 1 isoform X2 [Selaginella moellendorffii]|eukprot:XP_024539994.1 far upstream element-binding protein 1 isoform X2 [Selaginella moellendorffii]
MAESGRPAHGDYERRSSSPRMASSKRKYEEPVEAPPRQPPQQQRPPPPPPPSSDSQRPSYKSVPPPLSGFEAAKQRAEQIAARLVGEVEYKRARTSADDNDGVASNVERAGGHYGHQDDRPPSDSYVQHQTKRVDVPNTKVGLVIGKGGETIRTLQQQSGAKIQVTRDAEADPGAVTRQVELTGTPEQISRAEQLIREVVGDGIVGGPVGGGGTGSVGDPIHVRVPNNKVGLIIGKGGETIRNLQQTSGARIQVQHDRETEPGATERIVTLVGTKQQTDIATDMIKDVIGEGRSRAGGYQQGFRPAWGGQSQSQSGYGYQQQQGYGSQQYGNYWDQNQQQGGSYDYYQNSEGGGQQNEGDPNYNYGQQGYYYDQQAPYDQQYPQGYDQSGYNQAGGYNQDQEYAGATGYGYEYDQSYAYDQSGQYAQAAEGGAAAANAAANSAAASAPGSESYSQQPPPASSSAAQTAHT